MTTVGVVTFPTYMSDDCLSQGVGSSQNGLSKKLYVNSGTSVSPAKLSQSITGHRTAAAAKRFVWPMTQLESTPPPEQPPTYMLCVSTYPRATRVSTPAMRSS